MHPKTFYGWYNKLIRGYNYNDKTAHLLDHNFRPNRRLLSTLENGKDTIKLSEDNFITRNFNR
jgi:hypothetical protein